MDRLPVSIVTEHVMMYLCPQDKLSLGMANKELYKSLFERFPLLRSSYGYKHKIAMCIYEMIDFIKRGPIGIASWMFVHIKPTHTICFEICRRCRQTYISINDNILHELRLETIMGLFDSYIIKNWNNIQLHTKCWYKSKEKRARYAKMTADMLCLLRFTLSK